MSKKTIEEKISAKQQEIEKLDERHKEIAKQKKKKQGELKLLKHEYLMDILEKNDIDSSTELLSIISERKEQKKQRHLSRNTHTKIGMDRHHSLDRTATSSVAEHSPQSSYVDRYEEA